MIDTEKIKKIVQGKTDDKKPGKQTPMAQFVKDSPEPPKAEDLVEGLVIAVDKAGVYIDLRPFGTGIIYGREYNNSRDVIKKINIGDSITAKVVDPENENGYVELSLKEARQAMIWEEAEVFIKDKSALEVSVKDANKGGLIISWQGIQGFLPASQLKPEHYPRVDDGDKGRILEELRKLVGEKLLVSIITADPKEGKLIFSEKDPEEKDRKEIVGKYKVGDVFHGEVTGVVDFGVFVKIEDGLEGLVHISEIDWGLVEDPRSMFNVGEKLDVKIIEIKDAKISLSIKALKENPWVSAEKKYKKDATVSGVVIKYNQYGALASVEEGVAGLVHISEFGTTDALKQALELGKTYQFKINIFEPKEQRMTLSLIKEEEK